MSKKSPRQGDLLFVPRPDGRRIAYADPAHPEKDPGFKKSGIIREGEATGHHHKIKDPSTARVFVPREGMPIVDVGSQGATVTHPEHGEVNLEPNTTYDVHFPREQDLTERHRSYYVAD